MAEPRTCVDGLDGRKVRGWRIQEDVRRSRGRASGLAKALCQQCMEQLKEGG